MKKALLILLALTMIMSMTVLAPVTASAAEESAVGSVAADYKPEGTAVTTAEEFAKMDAAGKYYLAADITLSQSYEQSFTGVFDGNGHTIDTTATLFLELNGTVKNLTVTGYVEDAAELDPKYSSVVARKAAYEADTVIDNVCNRAAMKSQYNGMGSMVGRGGRSGDDAESILTITNCVNYGSITTYFAASANNDSGGIIGVFYGKSGAADTQLIIDGCVNYGTINAYGRPGGIIGYCATSVTIKNCVNNGAVQAIDNYCGGIAGRLITDNGKDNVVLVENCVNNADVNYNGTKTAQIGGMVGYLGSCKSTTFKNCTNNGNITAVPRATATGANIGGMVGSGKDANVTGRTLTFDNCVNTGNLTLTDWNGDAYAAGLLARGCSHEKIVFNNCANSGDITITRVATNKNQAGGIAANMKYQIKMTNCINTGDVSGNYRVAGLITEAGSGGTASHVTLTNCGNTGNITSEDTAGGLVAYIYGTGSRGPAFTYCFNTGDVKSSGKWASGFVGYCNAGAGKISHSYVAGKIENTIPATTVASGDEVAVQTEYTFNEAGTDYYFYAPVKGVVTITGTNVTIDTLASGIGAATAVTGGETATKDNLYKFTFDGDTYYFKASAKGAIAIDGKTVTCGGAAQTTVTKVESLDVKVFDHRINSRAIVWSNVLAFEIDDATIIIEEGTAGLDYVMGAANTVNCLGGMSDSIAKYTHAQFASGEVAYQLNQLAGKEVFFQNLMPSIFVVDEYPTTDKSHAEVTKTTGGYTNQLLTENPNITPATGDATVYVVVAMGVSVVALAGLAISKKRKVRN